MATSFWSGVQVAIESALGAAQTIDSITKASPGVVTYQGADPTDGDYLLYAVQGMYQLDGRVLRCDNTNSGGNTTEIEGINTSAFGTFSSGTFQPVTFGTSLTTAVGVNSSGGEPEFADITTIHDLVRKRVPVVVSPFSINFDLLWDPSDAAQAALKAAAEALDTRCVKLTFANGKIVVFNGYVSFSGIPGGSAQERVTTPVVIEAAGAAAFYAS